VAVLALAAVTTAVAPAGARAGGVGHWTQVTSSDGVNIDEVATQRTPDGILHVAWKRKSPGDPNSADLVHTSITPAGVAQPAVPIVEHWATIDNPALVLTPGDGLRAFWGGIRTVNPDETQSGLDTAIAPQAGSPWTLVPGNVVSKDSAYGSPVAAVTLNDAERTPLETWFATIGTFVHRGLDPLAPDSDFEGALGGCCGYYSALAVDGAAGQPWLAWFSNATGKDGLYVQAVDPASGAATGTPALMPGSQTLFNGAVNADPQLQRTGIVGRPGKPGVFVAYPGGYPTHTKVLVWQVGGAGSTVLAQSSGSHEHVTAAAAPDGRVWVLWTERRGANRPVVLARRSNPEGTEWGAVVSANAPAGATDVWKLDADAQAGPLDVLGSFSTPSALATWHTQLLPGITLTASPAQLSAEHARRVTLHALDAGGPLKGATISLGGRHGTTDAAGAVTLMVGPVHGRLTATASKSGYTSAHLSLRAR
jgi:hypothetical protein